MKLKEFLQKLDNETTFTVDIYEEDPPDWVTDVSFNEVLDELKQAKLSQARLKEANRQRLLGMVEKKIISDNIKTHQELHLSEHR